LLRVDGTTLTNANSDALTSLKIESEEDFQNNHVNDTTWEYSAKTPGSWANGLKVCTIDSQADQIITGIGTTALVTTVVNTVATKTGNLGITTSVITGITTSLLTVGDTVVNANFASGTTIASIGSSTLTVNNTSTNTGALNGQTFTFTQTTSISTPTDVRVGYAVTQKLDASIASSGTVTTYDGYIRGIITEIGVEQISVKIVDRVSSAGVKGANRI